MPAKAPWLLHLPEIVAQLEVFDVPVVDRAMVESVFGLLHPIPICQSGAV